jgi:hypothetical protein
MRSLKNSNYFEWILALKWPLTCKKKVQMRGEKNRRTRSISAVKIIFLLCFEHRYSLHVLLLLLILLLIFFLSLLASLSRLSSHNCTKIFFNDVPLQALTLSLTLMLIAAIFCNF